MQTILLMLQAFKNYEELIKVIMNDKSLYNIIKIVEFYDETV